jgi:diacylglycerol kinase family enzyme
VAQQPDRVPVFLNAAAGLSSTASADLADRLGADVVDVRTVEPGDLAATILEAAADGADVVGVAGGDGTISTAAGALAGTRTALACVPTGTLNNFARRVGVQDLDDAAAALRDRTVRRLAVGTVEGRVFLNTVTIGEYSRIVRMRERLRSFVGKWPGAVLAFGASLFSYRRVRVTLTVDGTVLNRATPFVWIGMGWGSFPRVHEAPERRRDPDLEIAVLRSQRAAAGFAFLLRLGVHMLRGRQPVRDRSLEILHARTITIDSAHRVDGTADGEVVRLKPPVRIDVRDDALSVLVGPRFEEGGGSQPDGTARDGGDS